MNDMTERYPQNNGLLPNDPSKIDRQTTQYCQRPSTDYMALLADCEDDPRTAVSVEALQLAGKNAERGWFPTYDARDRRR